MRAPPSPSASYATLAADFVARGIPTDRPGFFDDLAFLAVERTHASYLENYARFVESRPNDGAYRARAAREIPEIARLVHRELVQDGRLGACIDLSMMLGRILDRAGFWNYQTKGALTITFPAASGIGRRYFWPIDPRRPATGHSWLVAPPFLVLDLTVKRQPHTQGTEYLPDYVLAADAEPDRGSADDVMSPEVRADLRRRDVAPDRMLEAAAPRALRFWQTFPPRVVRAGDTLLKYVATGAAAPEDSGELPTSWRCNGRTAGRMYDEVVLPALEAGRGTGR